MYKDENKFFQRSGLLKNDEKSFGMLHPSQGDHGVIAKSKNKALMFSFGVFNCFNALGLLNN